MTAVRDGGLPAGVSATVAVLAVRHDELVAEVVELAAQFRALGRAWHQLDAASDGKPWYAYGFQDSEVLEDGIASMLEAASEREA